MQTTSVHADAVHKAVEGDTFYLLAKKYGVDMNKLMAANPSINPKNIYAGLKITIPGVQTQTTGVASAAPAKKESAATTTASASKLKVMSTGNVVEAWGKTFTYSKTINVKASAYSASASENGKWGAVDYFGNPLKLGTIAVDPNVIPMGTKVLVTGHNHDGLPDQAFVATATDQGGAIKGNRIDIFIPGSAANAKSFGFQDVTLYVLN
ncbi:3D domain-containing protein [Paenibacillus phoenicis]|uniref:3D domain-containing protein n=2 Tax=Paenibacillus TaxID=44249 RepID=A0ABU5PIU3_9BACL|nr:MULTISPECIES: 3D domain-containing protein [Paenibacillus]MCT2194559.1 3D domain-containing protein [Paenibacillus sp. p3-SID1389]MEA3569617.1 3D domain-containing protein [Paenibacillus phoenicis]